MIIKPFSIAAAAVAGALSLGACDLDVPDLNNAQLNDLQNHPTAVLIGSACTGLLIGSRANIASENGYVDQLGILGREAYNFDAADPRYVTEIIQGPLDRSSPFGGAFWGAQYTNIRVANIVIDSVDKVVDLTDEQKSAVKGYAHTIQALDLLAVENTHYTSGIVVDTDQPIGGKTLGALVAPDAALKAIAALLDTATGELAAGGKAFSFPLSAGYENASSVQDFLKFNRALRARVALYQKDYAMALTALSTSFLTDDPLKPIPMDLGVFHSYSTGSGDTSSSLNNPNIFAHPALQTDAQKNGNTVDARYTAKVTTADKAGASMGYASTLAFTMYTSPTVLVPIIRNEELILIKAEARFMTGDTAGATTELNLVRTGSGGLTGLAPTADMATFVNELLYERRYSLLFEGGHRWIDLRRFGQMLPLDMTTDTRNVRYPIPQAECDGRPGEPACDKTSTDLD